jgi:hypothetical protein
MSIRDIEDSKEYQRRTLLQVGHKLKFPQTGTWK